MQGSSAAATCTVSSKMLVEPEMCLMYIRVMQLYVCMHAILSCNSDHLKAAAHGTGQAAALQAGASVNFPRTST